MIPSQQREDKDWYYVPGSAHILAVGSACSIQAAIPLIFPRIVEAPSYTCPRHCESGMANRVKQFLITVAIVAASGLGRLINFHRETHGL